MAPEWRDPRRIDLQPSGIARFAPLICRICTPPWICRICSPGLAGFATPWICRICSPWICTICSPPGFTQFEAPPPDLQNLQLLDLEDLQSLDLQDLQPWMSKSGACSSLLKGSPQGLKGTFCKIGFYALNASGIRVIIITILLG